MLDVYLRAVLAGGALFLFLFTVPILAKWLLIGRWKPREIRVWSLGYLRFWIVKTLVRFNPLVLLFVGSPLYSLYLRALGAKIGRGVVIFSKNVPVCTDLLTIGDGSVIRKDSFISCYRAHAGMIQTGAVTLGKDVFVGEVTVIDIETSMGDGAQLGHSSSLHVGQAVPDGEHWHGSPAQRAAVDYRTVEPATCGTRRRAVYTVLQLLNVLALYLPLGVGGMIMLLKAVPQLTALLDPATVVVTTEGFYLEALVASFVLFFGSLLVGLVVVLTVPRVLNLAIKPDKVYPLYGLHYSLHRTIVRMTNLKFYTYLFGDSSYIVNYLRWLGLRAHPRAADRVELRPDGEAREPLPELDRQRDDGRRRAVDHQRRLLEQLVPRVPGVGRGTQLPREPHRLPLTEQGGRQLPPRHEGPGAHRRQGPGGGRPAGLTQLRDPADGRARQQARPPDDAGRAASQPQPPRTGTTS